MVAIVRVVIHGLQTTTCIVSENYFVVDLHRFVRLVVNIVLVDWTVRLLHRIKTAVARTRKIIGEICSRISHHVLSINRMSANEALDC